METAESRALHSDVKLNKAGVMFSFISPVIALTVCVMVPGKMRVFWDTVWICWEFWPQSPLPSALHGGENRHRSVRLGCYEKDLVHTPWPSLGLQLSVLEKGRSAQHIFHVGCLNPRAQSHFQVLK